MIVQVARIRRVIQLGRHSSRAWHEQIIYRASGVKFVLCGHGKGRRDLSAEHSMRTTVGYGGPGGPWPGRGAGAVT